MYPCILSTVVNDLVGTAGVLAAIHVSPEGLVLGASPGVDRDEADHWAAVMAALNAVSNRGTEIISRHNAESSPWGHSLIEDRSGRTLIRVGAADGSMLAVVCAKTDHLGEIAFRLVQLADDEFAPTEAA
ncbi:roadblock/LC7 domain-containing protein [Streptomyces sp. LS1784]|uniref:roadblock/LC7 domain-containing protein n=1 Tax=Streptomyces sp. LS1784 TaxID=2851533 RepID=UPI001CCB207B|nr:roadblock/LC7 domain-containing protein [Streptomyces sp. LS1784]